MRPESHFRLEPSVRGSITVSSTSPRHSGWNFGTLIGVVLLIDGKVGQFIRL